MYSYAVFVISLLALLITPLRAQILVAKALSALPNALPSTLEYDTDSPPVPPALATAAPTALGSYPTMVPIIESFSTLTAAAPSVLSASTDNSTVTTQTYSTVPPVPSVTGFGTGLGPQGNSSAPYFNSTINTSASPTTMNAPITMTSIVVVPPPGAPTGGLGASSAAPTRTSTGVAVAPTVQAMAVALGAAMAGIAAVVV
jgi:hypothetical protein